MHRSNSKFLQSSYHQVLQKKQKDYVIRFLKGINESYMAARLEIILMEPLPSINFFSLLILQERGHDFTTEEPKFWPMCQRSLEEDEEVVVEVKVCPL